ncbi:Leucine-Rich Repeat-Containing Protein 56 [Manis pentadactyla]|nr:Leucine-Rich Repeat-Containing Protein 56 [Manis pentadactyla]
MASVLVQELSWQGLHNPCPQSKDWGSHGGSHCELLVEYLSPALLELYVSYDDISDLSPLEQLEVLDLEGNSVEGLGQLRYLQLCPRLATLTLQGNLVCLRPSPCNKKSLNQKGLARPEPGPWEARCTMSMPVIRMHTERTKPPVASSGCGPKAEQYVGSWGFWTPHNAISVT